MKHRNRVIVNRPYKACVKPKQFGPSRHNGAFIAYKKIQAFRCFLYHLRHVHIPRKVAGTCLSPLLIALNSLANFS